jgi:hypothetical protein
MGARDRWEEGDRLFTTWKGNTRGEHRVGHHLEPRWIPTRLTEILKENGFEHLPVHGLRHSFATLLLSRNVPVKDMQEVLGHSRPSVTLDVYWQAVAAASDRVAGKAGEILFSPGAGAEDTDPPDASRKLARCPETDCPPPSGCRAGDRSRQRAGQDSNGTGSGGSRLVSRSRSSGLLVHRRPSA